MLYFGKFGALAVGFFLMPAYSYYLGPASFSTVAFILSLVNAAVTLDFGMSTIIGRDSSDSTISNDKKYKQFLASQFLVIFFYLSVFSIVAIYSFLFQKGDLGVKISFLSVILIMSSLIQNISVSYLNGIKEFKISGSLIFLSVTLRGVISLLVIKYIDNNIISFMSAQSIIGLLFSLIFMLLPSRLDKEIKINNRWGGFFEPSIYIKFLLPLVKKGFPLLFMGVSATLVMQFDKIILSYYASDATLSAYYLAFTFSTIPILAIAGPIKQYFQPHIVSYLTQNNVLYRKNSIVFFWCLIVFVAVPSALGYSSLYQILSIWLGNNELIDKVDFFSHILLPAFVLGAISYFPSVLLVVAEDYRFQSVFAIITSIIFVSLLFILAISGNVRFIPWLFIGYFGVVILFCSIRCLSLTKVNLCIFDMVKNSPFAILIIALSYWVGNIVSAMIF
ncbi:O182 family O-antigen flippase [Escherichia coli]|uniref:O182 family O-antigen flippase n=1 Tax=Escherichia coli TaxID=562 RepID=UPI00111B01E4|nr:O182 family O-antigen flippase [Escherichia coli]